MLSATAVRFRAFLVDLARIWPIASKNIAFWPQTASGLWRGGWRYAGSRSKEVSEGVVSCCFKAGCLQSSIRPSLYALQDIEKSVGRRIRQTRKRKGITQDQLAEMAGLDRVHLYRLETGRQSMTLRTLKLVADALDVPVRELVKNI